MTMEYNAVVRKYSGGSLKVIGRLLITDLNDVPKDWTIRYNSGEVDRLTCKIQDICCSATNPLQIYPSTDKSFSVNVRNIFGKAVEVNATESDTVKILKWKIFQKSESNHSSYQELYICRNNREIKLKNSGTLASYGITGGSSVFLKQLPEVLTGVKYKAIDLEATYPRVSSKVESPLWARYSAGMNLCGTCPNQSCISRTLEIEVVIRLGHGTTSISLSSSKFLCPACNDFLMFPDKFLASCARALIRYKRAGEDNVKEQLLDAEGPGQCFQEVYLGYPYLIEVITVEPWRSPYSCVRCDTKILFKSQEYKMKCGHVVHKLCKPEYFWKKCVSCK